MNSEGLSLKIVADVNDAVQGLNQTSQAIAALKVEQRLLGGEMAVVTSALKANGAELAKNVTIEQTAIKNKLVHGQAYKDLKTQIQMQQQEERRLMDILTAKNAQLEVSKSEMKAYTSEMNAAGAGAAKLGRAVNNLTDANSLAAGGVMRLRRMLIGSAFTAAAFAISDVLVPAIAALVKGFHEASKAEEQYKQNQKTLNEVVEDGNKKAGEQINSLKILYNAATDVNESMAVRLQAVLALKTEFPDYFSKIKDETILNGNAKKSYDDLTDSIVKSSRAKAAKDRMDDLQKQLLDIDYQKEKINNAAAQEKTNAKAEAPKVSTFGIGSTGAPSNNLSSYRNTIGDARAFIEEGRSKAFGVQDSKAKEIQSQINFLTAYVGNTALTKAAITDVKIPKAETKDSVDLDKQRKEEFEGKQKDLENYYASIKRIAVENGSLTATRELEIDIEYLQKKFDLFVEYKQRAMDIGLEMDKKEEELKKARMPTRYTIPQQQNVKDQGPITPSISKYLKDVLFANALEKSNNDLLQMKADLIKNTVGPAFKQMYSDIIEGNKNILQSLIQMLKTVLIQITETLLEALALAAVMTAISGGSFAGGFGGTGEKSFGMFFKRAMKMNANGGIFTSATQIGNNVFGENSPEAVIPLNRMHEFASMAGGGYGGGAIQMDTVLRGEDIYLSYNNALKRRNRSY